MKPLTVDLLKRTVDAGGGQVNPVVQARAGKVISFVSARGGVGTTATAAHLAWHLAENMPASLSARAASCPVVVTG